MTYGADPLASEAADPRTDPARLAELAGAYPHLHPLIAANPACYDGLRDWMQQVAAQQASPAQPIAAAGSSASDAARRQVFGAPVEQGLLERAYTPVVDEGEERRKRTRKRVLWTVLGIVLGLAVAAGAVFGVLYASGTVLGGRSPEQAAERFALGLGNADPLGTLAATAPSEAASLRAPVEQLLGLDLGPAGTGGDVAAELRAALSLRFEGPVYSVEDLGDGIALVEPDGGTALLDGDPGALADVLTRLAEPALRAGLDVPLPPTAEAETEAEADDGQDAEAQEAPDEDQAPTGEPADPDAAVDAYREAAEQRLAEHLPAEIDLSGEEADAFAVVVVEEGGGWYASPLLTAAELAYRDLGDEAPPRGEVRAAADLPRYDTPLLAAEGLAAGIVGAVQGEGLAGAAAAMPLTERRLVEIYGEALIVPRLPADAVVELVELQLSAADTEPGELAGIGGAVELLLDGRPLEVTASCSTLEESENESVERCLADSALLAGLGAEEWQLVAVSEDGGWRVGGLASLGGALSIAVERYAQLVAAGEVHRLVDTEPGADQAAPEE